MRVLFGLSKYSFYEINYLGKSLEAYDENIDHTYFEKQYGGNTILDVCFIYIYDTMSIHQKYA